MIKFIFFIFNIILFCGTNLYSIAITVLPFTSANIEWIEEYMVDDGIPRTLEYSLVNTHLFEVSDYDLLISYFASYEIVAPYKTLQTNFQMASRFIKETFNSDYLISGEVLNFTLRRGGKDTANVEFKVNIIDINTLSFLKTFTNSASYVLPDNSPVYKSEDALFYESALGRASILASDKIVNDIVKFFNIETLSGIITRVEENKIFINLGEKDNVKIGDKFDIYKLERVLELPNGNTYTNNINTNIAGTNSYTNTNVHTNSLNQTFINRSNIPKTYFNTNNNTIEEYRHIRSNEKGDVWYTSEMLYRYRFYNNKEDFIASAEVIELYENYAILENKSDKEMELMMRVRINKNK
ncbi:hypothetical protein [Brachyspira catarrhinii]|uniref:Lipoprotein n=1 Tax=Brachyspira catarrhinii TaxID=2528966 RepID=A0ABY2TNY5_9SPIR|nr:hypothetical protein [Brachyspira catarrhinii]TKZ31559.1 hypothetical protein EZH24_09765 [Brachyspira catarrhinii]